ncbi:MAG: heme utilization cystosolic carrier protein HutX [Proteobacteria bacterium]|nr:heme utilization cystosolic carrier protein HutX [Pseudomonadota bacterium]
MSNTMMAAPDLKARLEAEPGVVIESFAADNGVTCRAVIEAMPASMIRFVKGNFATTEAFVAVMGEVAAWGDVTFIVHTDDGIFEFGGPIPPGSEARNYYNLSGAKGLHGHLRAERCAGICFMERPFFGRLSASILLFNRDGGIMFKIFVGRDDKRDLLPDQLAAFRRLADRLC